MKKSPTTIFAIALIVIVIGVLIVKMPDRGGENIEQKPEQSSVTSRDLSNKRSSSGSSAGNSADSTPLVELDPLQIASEEAPDYETYDLDDDGIAEIEPFVAVYSQIQTPMARIAMLGDARKIEPVDSPKFNKFLIQEAARSPDAGVREAARDALFEYGGKNAHASLSAFFEENGDAEVPDRKELEIILDDLALPSFKELQERVGRK